MPLTTSGRETLAGMMGEYGKKKGKQVFYATMNKHPEMKKKMEGREYLARLKK